MNVTIPSISTPMKQMENEKQSVLPLECLELHGSNVNHSVFTELCYWSMYSSQECQLKSLVITGADFDCQGNDPLLWLSMCSPLRRSLKRLVIKNCRNLQIIDFCNWALFFGTARLQCIIIQNSGLGCNDFAYLCQVLCANQNPIKNLKALDLRVGKYKTTLPDLNQKRYIDASFVSIIRCLSKLSNLEELKLDCVNNEQKLQLYKEWKAIKGSNKCFLKSDELSTFLHLSVHPKQNPPSLLSHQSTCPIDMEEEMQDVVEFEQFPSTSIFDSMINLEPKRSTQRQTKFSIVCGDQFIRRQTHKTHRKKPVLVIKKKTTIQPKIVTRQQPNPQSTVEKLWSRYKPPRVHQLTKKHQSQSRRCNRGSLMQQQSIEHYFPVHETQHPPKTKQRSKVKVLRFKDPYPNRGHPLLSSNHPRYFSDDELSDSSDDYDLDEERQFGPPPGGRTVVMEGAEMSPDLMGYIPDGFIRPDDEMVYTTSASDGEIERDLKTFKNRREIVLSESSVNSESHSEEELVQEQTQDAEVAEIEELMVLQNAPRSLKDPLDELQKELLELQPFYYDKQRERYKPGKMFSDEAPNGAGKSGFVLRSGKQLNQEDDRSVEADFNNIQSHDNLEPANEDEPASSMGLIVMDSEPVLHQTDTDPDVGNLNELSMRDRKRPSRETLQLQPWSWDRNYEKCPPNEHMYLASNKKRRGRKKFTKVMI
eukprot:g5441.t1